MLREAIVNIITAGPKSVAASVRERGEAEGCVVCWERLELDVRVPLSGIVAAFVGLELVFEELFSVLPRE